MKENNYWRQKALEDEELSGRTENEHDLKLEKEKRGTQKQDGQQRRKIWQRFARRKAHRTKLIQKNHSRSDLESGHSRPNEAAIVNIVAASDDRKKGTGAPIIDNSATATAYGQNDHQIDGDNGYDHRNVEIMQSPSEQQRLMFPAVSAKLPLMERQQVKCEQKQQQPIKTRGEENEPNLSFCGCGFLGIYHVGVASCFHEYAPQLSMHKISGSSAGALVAVAHICGNLQLAYATTDILRVAIDARARSLGPFHPSFDINSTVREALEKGLPEDVHLRASGKLHVSLTRVYDGENVIISQFDTKEDVIQVLLCSCFIPLWSGLVAPKFKGVTYIDGGFSNNLLILDDKTVTVSPFSGEADICPRDDTFNLLQVSLSNTSFSLTPDNLYRLSHALLPPPPEVLSELCEQGFADGIRFLQQMKLITCTRCLEIRSSLLVTTTSNDEEMEEACETYLNQKQQQQQTHYSQIILKQQEQKTIQINTATGQRRDSICSTTSQVFIQQKQNSSSHRKRQLDSSSSLPSLAVGGAVTRGTPQRIPSSWRLDIVGDSTSSDATSIMLEDLAGCIECVRMRQRALSQPMPKQFSDRIRDASDAVNKSLSNWIYSHRPIKYLSYLAAPYLLPLDISLALVYKCWRRLPFIDSEPMNLIQELVGYLINMMKSLLAHISSTLLVESSLSWECRTATTSSSSRDNSLLSTDRTSTTSSYLTSSKTTTSDQPHYSLRITADGLCLSKKSHHSSSTSQVHSLEDTFDSILDVTSHQEAGIFAYYFRDSSTKSEHSSIR